AATRGFYFLASRHLFRGPVGTFDEHVGQQLRNKFARRRFIENRHVVYRTERGQNLGAVLLGDQRSFGALVASDARVAIDRYNQKIAESARLGQTPDMARMKQIKTSIGENHAAAATLLATYYSYQFGLRNDFSHGERNLFILSRKPGPVFCGLRGRVERKSCGKRVPR